MSRYLIYGLIDPRDRLIRYVGKSSNGLRRPRVHACPSQWTDAPVYQWIRALVDAELSYEVVVLDTTSTPREPGGGLCWWWSGLNATVLNDLERWWIAFGLACGWPLTNATAGGDGVANPASSTRARKAAAGRRNWQDPQFRARLSGEHHHMKTTTSRARQVEITRALWASPEYRNRMTKVQQSSEYLDKQRASARYGDDNPARRPEVRERISQALRQLVQNRGGMMGRRMFGDDNPARRPEVRAKISAARRARAAEKRAQREDGR